MAHTPDLASYDIILINTSGGKDSQAMLTTLVAQADAEGVSRDKMIAVHCDLGRAEWEGTKELAAEQAAAYGLRFEVVAREKGDLLTQIEQRRVALDTKSRRLADQADKAAAPVDALGAAVIGALRLKSTEAFAAPAFPSSEARYCTSDQKTAQVLKLMTALVKEADLDRPVRILNCLGIRAQESDARAKKASFGPDAKATNGKREVDRWLPIFDMTEDEVWATIKASGLRHHRAYDLGMTRLSCCFCVLASKGDLITSAKANPALAAEYVAIEGRVRGRFTDALSMSDIIAAATAA